MYLLFICFLFLFFHLYLWDQSTPRAARTSEARLVEIKVRIRNISSISSQQGEGEEFLPDLDEMLLFRQPKNSHLGDCPICLIPLSIDVGKSTMQSCCSQVICDGCAYSNMLHLLKQSLDRTCPFCRHPVPKTDEEIALNVTKRVEANDPVALREMGNKHYQQKDYESAFKYYTKAVELGDIQAHFSLGVLYRKGQGVDEKDENKETYHFEEAAIGGHPTARHNLGCTEWENGRFKRAAKHFIIATNLGYDDSLQGLKECCAHGDISKEELTAALHAYQAALEATKSPQREGAAEAAAAAAKTDVDAESEREIRQVNHPHEKRSMSYLLYFSCCLVILILSSYSWQESSKLWCQLFYFISLSSQHQSMMCLHPYYQHLYHMLPVPVRCFSFLGFYVNNKICLI